MISRVSSKCKEKQAKRKNSVKKQRPNRKKTERHAQGNRKQRRRKSNPVYLHVQATPWPLHHRDTHDLKI